VVGVALEELRTQAADFGEELAAFFASLPTDLNPRERRAKIADYMLGLCTPEEIREIPVRQQVKNRINQDLRGTGNFVHKDISTDVGCSPDLVARVWRAMCRTYSPADIVPSASLRIAIAKEDRVLDMIAEDFNARGVALSLKGKQGILFPKQDFITSDAVADSTVLGYPDGRRDLVLSGYPLKPQAMQFNLQAGQDILEYMRQGLVDVAVIGTDKVKEFTNAAYMAGGSPLDIAVIEPKLGVSRFSMYLAVPKENEQQAKAEGLRYFNGRKLITSYPDTLKRLFNDSGVEALEIKVMKGGCEKACRDFKFDGLMDIVQSGKSLEDHNMVRIGAPIFDGAVQIVCRRDYLNKVSPLVPENGEQGRGEFMNFLALTRFQASVIPLLRAA
jgi:uncharacterized protein YerC